MKKLAGALGATMLAITIVALYLWSQLHTERQQLAALQARVSELEVQQKTAAEAAAASALAIAANSTAAASPMRLQESVRLLRNRRLPRRLATGWPPASRN